jgi:chromosome partitioning protein
LRETRYRDTPLGTRKAFSNAAAVGRAVTELHPPDAKASDEILALYRYVFDISTISSTYRKRSA